MQNESNLIAQAAAGDADAFEALVRLHEKRVYNTILRIVRHPDDAYDLSQEVFLRVWRRLPKFREESSFSTWLYRICHNMCFDFLKKKSRRREEPLAAGTDWPDNRFDPPAVLEKKEFLRGLEAAMGALSPEHRAILSLREVSGLSYTEIASVLTLEEGTVKSRIARARMALRDELKKDGNNFGLPSSK